MIKNCLHCGKVVVRKHARFCTRICANKGYIVSEETRKKLSERVVSEETRKKLSIAHTGKVLSEETRKKLSIAHKGKVLSEETRNKISDANKGKLLSEETRKKLSERVVSEEHRKKISEHIVSEETRKKLSIAHKGKIVSAETKEKAKQTRFKSTYNKLLNSDRLKDLVIPLFTLEEFNGARERKQYQWKCKKCGNIFEDHIDNGRVPRCQVCFPINTWKSHYEDNICIWLKELSISNIVRNDRQVISPLELDIYLPDYKVAIEFNGLFWHSEIAGSKSKEYHLDKTIQCEKQGIQLVHIFEDEWIQKQEIVKSIIKSKLGLITNRIYARECTLSMVPNEIAKAFLFDNHLQVQISCKYYFGLYHEHALVYLIGISKPRFNKDYQYELVRSCPLININVVGGFSKLIKYAVQALSISTMISYVDRRYFTGKGYKDWKFLRSIDPNYYYIVNGNRESRIKYQKHKLQALFPNEYEDILTEWEIMQLANYDRIYDCGNLVYEYKEENN